MHCLGLRRGLDLHILTSPDDTTIRCGPPCLAEIPAASDACHVCSKPKNSSQRASSERRLSAVRRPSAATPTLDASCRDTIARLRRYRPAAGARLAAAGEVLLATIATTDADDARREALGSLLEWHRQALDLLAAKPKRDE